MPVTLNRFLLKEPQRTYKWRASFGPVGREDVPTGSDGGIKDLFSNAVESATEAVTNAANSFLTGESGPDVEFDSVYIESISVPQGSFSVEEYNVAGTTYKLPVKLTVPEVAIVFQETAQGDISKNLEKWRKLMYDPEQGTWGLPADYSGDIDVQLLTGYNTAHTVYTLEDCFPTNTSPIDLAYTNSGQVLITQTFSVQEVILDVRGILDALQSPLDNIGIPGLDLSQSDLGLSAGGIFQ